MGVKEVSVMLELEVLESYAQSLDRSLFLDEEYQSFASLNRPLPIGYGQTISQPTLVVEMTYLLSPEPDSRVLEIGTGSGYQTAFLAHFARRVYTMERVGPLLRQAKKRLAALKFTNILYQEGDGSGGWSEHAPYDRIMVTAAARTIPPELLEQLAPLGRMVIPVGPPDLQELMLVTKDLAGNVKIQVVELVRFVELRGKYGWMEEKKRE